MIDARFSRHAEVEFEDAIAEYESQRAGRGSRFRVAVRAAVNLIRSHPKIGTPYREPYRKRLVQNFPYLIFTSNTPSTFGFSPSTTPTSCPTPGLTATCPPPTTPPHEV